MGRENIYIRKKNEAKWDRIKRPSDWINGMLEKPTTDEPAPIKQPPAQKKLKIIKTPEDAAKAVETITPSSRALRFCPLGHLLPDGRNKCMAKGCKFS